MIKLKGVGIVAGGLFMDRAIEEYCFNCSKKRPCKIAGTYRYEGETHKIYVCQWCRAAITKRQRSESPVDVAKI